MQGAKSPETKWTRAEVEMIEGSLIVMMIGEKDTEEVEKQKQREDSHLELGLVVVVVEEIRMKRQREDLRHLVKDILPPTTEKTRVEG